MIKKSLLSAFFILLFAAGATAQVRGVTPKRVDTVKPDLGDQRSKDSEQNVNFPEDMRSRMERERTDSEYRRSIEDADKLNDLSSEIAKSYRDHGRLSAEELKKIGTIEKLAKRILNQSGGDEVDDKNNPGQRSLPEAIEQLSEAAANIQKTLKVQTKFVVSAIVISNSNDVINLAQFIRHSIKAD
ncbi:MAG: hypothetical protein WBV94_29325 [Blastocatellia bacterium]